MKSQPHSILHIPVFLFLFGITYFLAWQVGQYADTPGAEYVFLGIGIVSSVLFLAVKRIRVLFLITMAFNALIFVATRTHIEMPMVDIAIGTFLMTSTCFLLFSLAPKKPSSEPVGEQ